MAIGFPPKYVQDLRSVDLTNKNALIIALEAVKLLDWKVGYVSADGFIAYTKFSMSSWSEKVEITFVEGGIHMESECSGSQLLDWGKNKKNIQAFLEKFNTVREKLDQETIDVIYDEIENELAPKQEGGLNHPPASKKEKIADFLSIFKPTRGYFITPILLNLNIAVFVVMAFTGVNIMLPDSESLLLWGANFRPATLDGEWWRLISSCFLHIGIFHLLMNMYALVYIGLLLEPYFGKSRFLSAYLLTGLAGSTASLYWNELTISAGASGAIFGMYGVFLAMLTTNLIEKSARKSLLTSIGVFVGYNLLFGLQGGIDNAAHIGGLVSGLIVGYAYYPSVQKSANLKLKYGTMGALSLLFILGSLIVLTTTSPSDISKYEEEMEQFGIFERRALILYSMPETSTDQDYLTMIQDTGIPNWQASIELLERADRLELPATFHARNAKLIAYCQLRLKVYRLIEKAISEGTERYQPEIERSNKEIESIINALSEQ